jgi:LysM repeat protein
MYLFLYRLRILLTIVVVVGVAGGVITLVSVKTYEEQINTYNQQVTAAVATAIQGAVYDVTRTVEAPSNRYQLVTLEPNTDLQLLAQEYGTSLELLQIVNGLATTVTAGSGDTLVVPVGFTTLDPLRTVTPYRVMPGDTLDSIARRYVVEPSLLEADNPMLALRGLLPGDIVFIGLEL